VGVIAIFEYTGSTLAGSFSAKPRFDEAVTDDCPRELYDTVMFLRGQFKARSSEAIMHKAFSIARILPTANMCIYARQHKARFRPRPR